MYFASTLWHTVSEALLLEGRRKRVIGVTLYIPPKKRQPLVEEPPREYNPSCANRPLPTSGYFPK